MAVVTPTAPFSQRMILGTDRMIHPQHVEQRTGSFTVDGIRIDQDSQGCLGLALPDGRNVGPFCHRHLTCWEKAIGFEVFKLPDPGRYYVETYSACHSACCDRGGMTFGREGRLDDGLGQRIWRRLDVVGSLALGLSLLLLLWRTRRPSAHLWWRVASLAGLACAMALVWWNR
ncbi:Hypothetical protein A7982_06879 [Minicystis rosea]|nr:Hypothetical protein A7982_06879 [Minicystis rosea]